MSGRISGIVLVVAVAGGLLGAGCSTSDRPSASGSSAITRGAGAPTTLPGTPGLSSPTSVATPTTISPSVVCGIVPAPDVTVTSASGCDVRASLGADIEVELGSSMRWSDPSSNSGAVIVVSIDRPAAGGLQATLRASALGQATVSADGVAACDSGQICPALAELWRVTITVS